jgi:hypothetical protein
MLRLETCSFGNRRIHCFGNFDVNITVPADHVMEATGELYEQKKYLLQEQDTNWLKNHLISLL